MTASDDNFENADANEFRESGKIPIAALRVSWRGRHTVEIPASLIKANDSFKFDPRTRTVTLELFADSVAVVTPRDNPSA